MLKRTLWPLLLFLVSWLLTTKLTAAASERNLATGLKGGLKSLRNFVSGSKKSASKTEDKTSSSDTVDANTLATLPELPLDIIKSIADVSDDKTSAIMGMVSKGFNMATEDKNQKNRLIEILNYCGSTQYLRLTSNGFKIFSRSLYSTSKFSKAGDANIIASNTQCISALINNIRLIGDKLTELTITLPSVDSGSSRKLMTALDCYFSALEALFKKKSNFEIVSVTSLYNFGSPVHSKTENRIVKMLSQLSIDFVNIQIKVRNPSLFAIPSIRKLRAQEDFYLMNILPNLSGLRSIMFPILNLRRFDLQGKASK